MIRRLVACGLLILSAIAISASLAIAQQQAPETRRYDIPAQPLADALRLYMQQSGVQVLYRSEDGTDHRSTDVAGTYTAAEALARLLAETGLTFRFTGPMTATLERTAGSSGGAVQLGAVRVSADREGVIVPPPRAAVGTTPPEYAGGMVARGARNGIQGDVDFLDSPTSTVAFTSEFRENTQALSVSDMLKYSVSASTPQAGAVPTTDVIYIRGFNIGSYDGTFNGLPGLLGRMPPVEGLERVEVLLGPSAFSNGVPYTTGGTINLVPKRAGETPLARVGVNYRTASILGTTFDGGRRFGEGQRFGIRVNAGFSDGNTELADARRRTFSRSVAFDARGRTTRFTVDYMGNDRRLPAEAWFWIADGVSVPSADTADRNFRQPWTNYQDFWNVLSTRGEWDFASRWTASAGFGVMGTRVERFSSVYGLVDNDGTMVDEWGTSASNHGRRATAAELSLRGDVPTGPVLHRVRAGYTESGDVGAYAGTGDLFALDSNIYAPVDYPQPDLTRPELPPYNTSRTRNRGLFFSDEIGVAGDRLRVTLGTRRVTYRSEYFNGSTGALDGDPYVTSRWSPAFGAVFKARENVSLYVNRLEALEPGWMVYPPAGNAGQIIPAMPADQLELGAKADFGRIGATAAFFDIDQPNIFLDPATNIEGPNGRQTNRGFELSLFGQARQDLRLYASASFIDPKLARTAGGLQDGNLPQSVARTLGNAYVDWDLPRMSGLSLLGSISRGGALFNDANNAQHIDGWTRVDLSLRFRTGGLGRPAVLRLNLDNLFNAKYFVSERGTLYIAPKRTLVLSTTFDLR